MSQTQMVSKAVLAILRSLPQTDVVRSVISAYCSGDHRMVSGLRCVPGDYLDASSFGPDYLAVNILRKWNGLETGIDVEEVARLGFLEQEARNAQFNSDPTWERRNDTNVSRCNAALLLASRKISRVLGRFNPVEFAKSCSFSSGASFSLPRRYGNRAFKYVHGELEVTSEAYPIARLLLEQSPRWSQHDSFRLVPGSRFATVPKDSTKDRCIVIDPRMNIYLQKGVGAMIRKRLKKVGINLDDQSVNKHLAYLGTVRNSFNLATIDLSAASDSITLKLVQSLLPDPWFRVLSALRSHRVIMPDGSLHELEMFSGMGNGFTFELESLLFWAISSSVIELNNPVSDFDRTCKVYGDDIVVPSRHYDDVTNLLVHCGFRVNMEKSYHYGGFRESCGGHYFLGQDVTPFYLQDQVDCAMDLIHIANSYHYWCRNRPDLADQGVFDYICSLAQRCAKGKMTMVPAREGLKAGLVWSPVKQEPDVSHAGVKKHCRRLPRFSTILVDVSGAAFVQDNDWNNYGDIFKYRRWSFQPSNDLPLPEEGRLIAALQEMEDGRPAENPYFTASRGKVVSRAVKTTSWCDFDVVFDIPSTFI